MNKVRLDDSVIFPSCPKAKLCLILTEKLPQ